METSKLQIVYYNVDDLLPYEQNPRRNDRAVAAVAASIDEFGFKVPIVIDSDKTIVSGHTRLKAAKQLGLKEVPVIVADDLTPEQITAFRLVDNKVSELATWDMDALQLELDKIDMDMEQFGFFEADDVDLDEFFSDTPKREKTSKEEEKETIVCPHCGEVIEL